MVFSRIYFWIILSLMGNIRVRLKIEVGIESQNRDVGVEKGPRGDSKVTKIT